jgi:G protein-coupled receptor Mth (Methuselah protein)
VAGPDDALHAVAKASGFPLCTASAYIIAGELEGNLSTALNGSALQLAPPPAPALTHKEFCLERVLENPGMVSVLTCARSGHSDDAVSVIDVHEDDIRLTLYPAGLAISAFFLAATLATGFLLPKAHHALHWRCQTCHVACLLVADVMLAVVQFAGRSIPDNFCVIMGEIAQLFIGP